MQKLIFSITIIASCASFSLAGFDENFKKSVREFAEVEVEIQFKKPLKSFTNQYFVIGRTQGGDIFPAMVSQDGNYFVALSKMMNLNKEDSSMIMEELYKAGEEKEKKDSKALNALFASFSPNDFIYLKGEGEGLPTKIVVTDPDCPYCRKQLETIEEELKQANLKLIFAPVHQKEAFIKAQLAMNQTAKLKVEDTKGKIKILRSFYQEVKLSKNEMATNITQVRKNTDKIFSSNLIKGVPFIFEQK
ncbi:thiol peroxidase [uncultured Helicobacter sp.]|uniref:thiol peroxidase n=1 Tax=uncultured Helicobacter sp. TaxID=175537 RepID=UPI002638512F|nr:thiol peroxidase [uncultured Helicobacter sp.]